MFKFESKEVVELQIAIERVESLYRSDVDIDAISKVADELRKKLAAAQYKEALVRIPMLRKACAVLTQEGIISRDSVPGFVDLWVDDDEEELRVEFQDNYPGIDEITIDLKRDRWQLWQYDCQLDPDEQEGYVSDWKD